MTTANLQTAIKTMPPRRQTQLKAFDRLLTIMDELREQCPWDRKQTLESLRLLDPRRRNNHEKESEQSLCRAREPLVS